ncbi:hypothetical protein [Aliagarivorans marinus]|uniref:hypothetical protein n=1 Tax=Aliagarivorans marinus TaxID=561965 RepID=UPI0003FCE9CF|nr:hypothetical protein [Aliagarivorans marinus]
MLSKPIYELLPTLYLSVGSGSVLYLDSSLGLAGGALLFLIGALVWVMRSNYRRQDEPQAPQKRLAIPENIYEFYPFILFATAIVLLQTQSHLLAYAVAFICLYRGSHVLFMRHRYRRQTWKHSGKHGYARARVR